MEDLKERLEGQLREINRLVERSNRNLAKLENVPDHEIRIGRSNGCYQYHLKDKNLKTTRYVRSSEIDSLRKIAQKGYEIKINKELLNIKRSLEIFLDRYDIDSIFRIYDRMSDARKRLVVPIVQPEEEFIREWKDEQYDSMPFYGTTEFYSKGGIRLRSKSELIIADILEYYDVPYKYERPLEIKGWGQVRPDFTCMNRRTRKEFIWEHFGMMDNVEYAQKNINKINSYQQNGYFAGQNMIMSFETSMSPVSSKIIKSIIEEYLV